MLGKTKKHETIANIKEMQKIVSFLKKFKNPSVKLFIILF